MNVSIYAAPEVQQASDLKGKKMGITRFGGLQFAAVGSEVLLRAREAKVGREVPTDWFLESVYRLSLA